MSLPGASASRQAAEAQQEVADLQTQQQNLSAARRRVQSVRESRVALADARNSASTQGVITSSAAQGGIGATRSQFTSNLSFLDNQNLIVDQTSQALGRQRRFEAKAARQKAAFSFITGGLKAATGFL